jgi:hypothetical protein
MVVANLSVHCDVGSALFCTDDVLQSIVHFAGFAVAGQNYDALHGGEFLSRIPAYFHSECIEIPTQSIVYVDRICCVHSKRFFGHNDVTEVFDLTQKHCGLLKDASSRCLGFSAVNGTLPASLA